jgi:hypothetical protein
MNTKTKYQITFLTHDLKTFMINNSIVAKVIYKQFKIQGAPQNTNNFVGKGF